MIDHNVKLDALIRRVTAAILVSATLCGPATADVYRWVEADGTVNYGERAPAGTQYTVVSRSTPTKAGSRIINRGRGSARSSANSSSNKAVANPASGTNPAPAADNLSNHQKEMLSEIQAAETARLAAVNKLRKENCATSKRVLSNLQASGRIRVRDDNGEETAMTDEERSKRIEQAHKSIVANCDSLS